MTKKILMTLALVLSLNLAAFAGPREDVTDMVTVMQALCPQEIGDGMSIENVLMDGDNVIMVMAMPIPGDMMSQMQSMIPMLKGEMLKSLKDGDADMKQFLKNIKAINGNFIISMTSSVDDCTPLVITFTSDEL